MEDGEHCNDWTQLKMEGVRAHGSLKERVRCQGRVTRVGEDKLEGGKGGVVFCRNPLASPSMALCSVVEEASPTHLSEGGGVLIGWIDWRLTRLL